MGVGHGPEGSVARFIADYGDRRPLARVHTYVDERCIWCEVLQSNYLSMHLPYLQLLYHIMKDGRGSKVLIGVREAKIVDGR